MTAPQTPEDTDDEAGSLQRASTASVIYLLSWVVGTQLFVILVSITLYTCETVKVKTETPDLATVTGHPSGPSHLQTRVVTGLPRGFATCLPAEMVYSPSGGGTGAGTATPRPAQASAGMCEILGSKAALSLPGGRSYRSL